MADLRHRNHCRAMMGAIHEAAPRFPLEDVFVSLANYDAIEREAVEAVQPRRAPMFDAFLTRCVISCVEGEA